MFCSFQQRCHFNCDNITDCFIGRIDYGHYRIASAVVSNVHENELFCVSKNDAQSQSFNVQCATAKSLIDLLILQRQLRPLGGWTLLWTEFSTCIADVGSDTHYGPFARSSANVWVQWYVWLAIATRARRIDSDHFVCWIAAHRHSYHRWRWSCSALLWGWHVIGEITSHIVVLYRF